MKFLVLALCVYSANAAFRGYQNPWQAGAQAVVQTGVPVAQTVAQAAAQTVFQPAVVAKKVLTGDSEAAAEVLKYDSEVNEKGFKYGFETENGISATSYGILKNVGDAAALVVEGAHRYTNPDGTIVELAYTADENGYQPRSDSLPVGPPTPDHVVRLLKYLEEHPESVERYNN